MSLGTVYDIEKLWNFYISKNTPLLSYIKFLIIIFVSNIYTKEPIITSFIRLPDLFSSSPWQITSGISIQDTDLFLETFTFYTKPPDIFERYGQSDHTIIGNRC